MLHLKANMLWHMDSTFLLVPALTNMLIGRIVTDVGGETQLASSRAGWPNLIQNLREQIRNKALWHSYSYACAGILPELVKLPMFHK